MTDPQPDREAEIRQRRAAITPPPWEVATTTDDQWFVHSPKLDAEVVVHDGDYTLDFAGTERTSQFIAHAPDDIDWLLAEVEGGRREVERLRQVNKAGSQQVEELLDSLGTWEQLVQDRNAEVERLRETEERLHEAQITIGKLSHAMSEHEVKRLRGLLGRLEWVWSHEYQDGSCPVCFEPKVVFNDDGTIRQGGHDPDCWLAAEIRPTSGEEQT